MNKLIKIIKFNDAALFFSVCANTSYSSVYWAGLFRPCQADEHHG